MKGINESNIARVVSDERWDNVRGAQWNYSQLQCLIRIQQDLYSSVNRMDSQVRMVRWSNKRAEIGRVTQAKVGREGRRA